MAKKPFIPLLLCITAVASMLTTLSAFSQTSKVSWGQEFRQAKGVGGLKPMIADPSGVYIQSSQLNRQGVSNNFDLTHNVIKVDKGAQELYQKAFDYKSGGYRFNSIQTLKGKMYVFYTDTEVKSKRHKIYASIIDNSTGAMLAPLKEVWSVEDPTYIEAKPFISKPGNKGDLSITASPDGEKFMFTLTTNEENGDYVVATQMDEQLNTSGKCRIKLSNETNTFELSNMYWLPSNKLLVAGTKFAFEDAPKGKKKIRVNKGVTLNSYNEDGSKLKDMAVLLAGKNIVNVELISSKSNDWLLAGFYTNQIPFSCINGFYAATINTATADVSNLEATPIAGKLLGIPEDAKSPATNEYFIVKALSQPENGGVMLFAEEASSRSSLGSHLTSIGQVYSYTQRTYSFNGALMLISIDKSNKISWLKNIPKWQEEKIVDEMPSSGSSGTDLGYLFASDGGWPFFSSFTSFISNGAVHILFNDNKENANALMVEPGKPVTKLSDFKKSGLYEVTVSLKDQAITKKLVQDNAGAPVPMPGYALQYDNKIYITALTNRNLSKSDANLGIITYK